MNEITRLNSLDPGFGQALERLLNREEAADRQIETAVRGLL